MEDQFFAKKIGGRIRFIRKQAGMSQEALADKSGLHTNYLGAIERGEKNVSVESIMKIARGLNVTLEELFRYIEPMEHEDALTKIFQLLSERSTKDHILALTLLETVFDWEKEKQNDF